MDFNMDFSNCYAKFLHLPEVSEETVNQCISAVYEEKDIKQSNTMRGLTLPKYYPILKNYQFIEDLKEQFGLIQPMAVRVDPYTLYDWHTDVDIPLKINYVLNDVGENQSWTLFKGTCHDKLIHTINECKYTLKKPMLFNTKIEHCVINNSDKARFLLSIRFLKQTIRFHDVKEFLLNYTTTTQI